MKKHIVGFTFGQLVSIVEVLGIIIESVVLPILTDIQLFVDGVSQCLYGSSAGWMRIHA